MKNNRKIFLIVLTTAFILTAVHGAAKTMTDPLQILSKHCEALGGLEKLKAQKSYVSEADFSMGNLKGTLKQWFQAPNLRRDDLDLKVFKAISGDDGVTAWNIDQNGKLLVQKDEESLKRRKVQTLLDAYAFMDPKSKTFAPTCGGIQKIGGADCYVIKITNTINKDIYTWYINTETFLMDKSVDTLPTGENHQTYSDYRVVEGIKVPFHNVVTQMPTNQTFVIRTTKYEANVPIDASLFKPPKQDVKDFRFLANHRTENVPFRFLENHILLTAAVGGKKSLWVLDSGAGMTVIDLEFAESIGLKPKGKLKGQGVGKTVEFSFVEVPSITLPGLVMEKQRVVAGDFVGPLLRKAWGLDIIGILGYDFMSRFVIKVDYANEKLSFYDPGTFQYKGDGKILPAPLQDRNFTVPMTIDGKYSGNWRVDLGAGGISFHYPYAKEKGFLNRKGVDWVSYGAGGGSKSRILRFSKLEFAGFTLKNPLAAFPIDEGKGAFMDKSLLGNIGNSVFRHFVIYLDYKKQQMIVEKGPHFGRRFPEDMSGLQVFAAPEPGKKYIEVAWVAPGTPGEKAGFKKDDIIKTINGKDAGSIGITALRELLKEKPGTIYKITVSRKGKILDMKLKLQDLYLRQE